MIRIITDSTSDMTLEKAKEQNVDIIPLTILFGSEAYRDRYDLLPDAFYEKLAQSEMLPTTSQPSPAIFEERYNAYKEDEILVLTIASALSGTYQSAVLGKDIAEVNARVVDSCSVTLGLEMLVDYAVSLRDAGLTLDEIKKAVEEKKSKIRLVAMVDTLEYLHKGGRLSKMATIAGGLLNMKPIIGVNQEGKLEVYAKARGKKKAISEIFKQMELLGDVDENSPIYFGHTGERGDFDTLVAPFKEAYPNHSYHEGQVGATIGTHVGPGAFVVVYFTK